jgi:hypothetical protein
MNQHKPKDYKGIELWGQQLGSYQYYIDGEQSKAVSTNAPIDALYWSESNGEWVCVSDLKEDHSFRKQYLEYTKHD